MKIGGNSGGQNGIQHIINLLGTKNFPRLKLGIGRPENGRVDMKDWVLGRFSSIEAEPVDSMLKKATDCLTTWVVHGSDKAMCDFNGESLTKVKKGKPRSGDPSRSTSVSEPPSSTEGDPKL